MDRQQQIFRLLSFGAKRRKEKRNAQMKPSEQPDIPSGTVERKAGRNRRRTAPTIASAEYAGDVRMFHLSEAPQPSSSNAPAAAKPKVKQQAHSDVRKKYNIFVHGEDVPEPWPTFQQICSNLHPQLADNVRRLGFQRPTSIQMQAVPVMLADREIMASAPTGSGKTFAFVIPTLNALLQDVQPDKRCCRIVVLEPTLELARQVYFEFLRLLLPPLKAYLTIDATNEYCDEDVIVSTPNRLIYALEERPELYNLDQVKWLIVDECDRLFEAGERGFREQLSKIYQACNHAQTRRALFSATFSYHLEQWCKVNLNSLVLICVGVRNSAVNTVKQELLFVGSEYGKVVALQSMFREGLQPPVLMFVQSKERVEQLFVELKGMNLSVDYIHADRGKKERDAVMKRFRTGEVPILICSELIGRGVDFKCVNVVINYDFPTSSVSYIHRIGRTGRAGREGRAITFFTEEDTRLLRSIGNIIKSAGCPVPDYIFQLPKASRKTKRQLASHAPKRDPINESVELQPRKKRVQ